MAEKIRFNTTTDMNEERYENLRRAWTEATAPRRRRSREIEIGPVAIGGDRPIAVQTMTDCDTKNIDACIAQIGAAREAGCRIVRLTTQGPREAEALGVTACRARELWPDVALVADVHFLPQVADLVAEHADKVRINPGNYNDRGGSFAALLDKCARLGTALRIGVNHGSLSPRMAERYGDTPEGMVESAMEFLRECRNRGFGNVAVSMKSSNTRVMVQAYRMLVAAMHMEGMDYPLHLGVTEAGNGTEGRIKSAVGIGALLADGVGDTIRVSLTEPPQNGIPVAQALADRFSMGRAGIAAEMPFDPFSYTRRATRADGRLGGGSTPLLWSELDADEQRRALDGGAAVLTARSDDPVAEWRGAIAEADRDGDRRPVILCRSYATDDPAHLALEAAADFGVMFIDGLADGIRIECDALPQETVDEISLLILQAARARMSRTEFVSCPGCGRTLYSLHDTLNTVKSRLSHLSGLRIAVMGCIVNGPGEMADADYGYVGASPGHISLYRGRTPVLRNIPQEEALDALIGLIRADGRWTEPDANHAAR